MESDVGDYVCSGMNEIGTAMDKIHLRVRSRWAALWPFLGIVAEVIILVTIIFIYEKRRKPDEINDGVYWMLRRPLGCVWFSLSWVVLGWTISEPCSGCCLF